MAFRQGRLLVGLGATATHCGLYLMNASLLNQFPEVVEQYDTSNGTIRFAADKPLPAALIRKLVKAPIAENQALGTMSNASQ